jgi:hypothetical protein
MDGLRGLRPWLCWTWLAAVLLYLVWGGMTQRGLYYWLGTLEIDAVGSYEPVLIGILPGFLLAAPALVMLRRGAARGRRVDGPGLRRIGLGFAAAALVALAMVAAALLLARQLSATGPARPLDAAALARGDVAEGPALIRGDPVPGVELTVAGGGRFRTADTVYRALRPAGETNGPLRLFDVRREQPRSDGAILLGPSEISGDLVRDGLPPLVRYALARRGARIAEPHYLLVPPGERIVPYHVAAGLAGFAAILLAIFASATLFLAERARLAAERGAG